MIKAYHQVGSDDRTPAQRKAYLKQVLDMGAIVPAIERVQRQEMFNECFTEEAQSLNNIESLADDSSPEFREALTLMAREKLALLPQNGSTHTLFNCQDLLAGDFERVFLSVGDWYSTMNGFVFDAEQLLMTGASYREGDLGRYYSHEIKNAASLTYDSVEDARREIEAVFERVREHEEVTGELGVTLLRNDCKYEKCPAEIVWPGPLPLEMAIEMWREGRRVKF